MRSAKSGDDIHRDRHASRYGGRVDVGAWDCKQPLARMRALCSSMGSALAAMGCGELPTVDESTVDGDIRVLI